MKFRINQFFILVQPTNRKYLTSVTMFLFEANRRGKPLLNFTKEKQVYKKSLRDEERDKNKIFTTTILPIKEYEGSNSIWPDG